MKQKSNNPGGRPKSFEREVVLDAAVQVFWEHGYEGASLDLLTKSMRINKPSLYSTFGNKHALFLAAIDRYVATKGAKQSAALRNEPNLKTAVLDYYREIINTVTSDEGPSGCLMASVAAEVAERDPMVRDKIASSLQLSEAYIDDRLQRDTGATGRMIVSAGLSFAQRARLGAPKEELQALAHDYVEHFFLEVPAST